MKSLINVKRPQSNVNKITSKIICFIGPKIFLLAVGLVSLNIAAQESDVQSNSDELNWQSGQQLYDAKSIAVKYPKNHPKTPLQRYAKGLNNAQQLAFNNLDNIESTIQTRKTRDQIIKLRQTNSTDSKLKAGIVHSTTSLQSYQYVEFDIYSAHSSLLVDDDYDGFYQTFSVVFDADVYGSYSNQRAHVFADLYLSRDGGPWELYYTTKPFVIMDNSSEDEFEVLTTLDSGFATSHYDVLIDLYEVGYSGIVATISSDDVDGLYGLPLESADRDENSYSSEIYIEAGSNSFFALVFLVLSVMCRFKTT